MTEHHPLLLKWIEAGRETMRLRRELDAAQDKERRARDTYEKVFRASVVPTVEQEKNDS